MRGKKVLKVVAIALLALGLHAAVPETAEAHLGGVRRTSRRVSRRTSRRVVRRHMVALPAVYTTTIVAGVTYYVIDGVRYVKQIQGGQVVYVVVG